MAWNSAQRLRGLLSIGLILALFAGCDSSPDSSADLSPVGSLSESDIRFFLQRTQFAATDADVAAVQSQGLGAFVDSMLTYQDISALENQALSQIIPDPNFPGSTQIADYWYAIMQDTPQPFQEVMALFWHDHFGVAQDVLGASQRHYMLRHIASLRQNGTGNLREFLYEMSTDWAMMVFLDGRVSIKGNPNENFAREFFELFTLGVNNGYEEYDVQEASRAFTGYRERFNDPVNPTAGAPVAPGMNWIEFQESRQDQLIKNILGVQLPGRSGPDAFLHYRDVVEHTLRYGKVAEFVARKLFSYFCYPNPPQSVVNDLAAVLRANDWELKPMLKRMLTSKAFFSSKARMGIIKSPVEHTVGLIRSTGLVLPPANIRVITSNAGQYLTYPPSVAGWPKPENGQLWLATINHVERANAVRTMHSTRTLQNSRSFNIHDLFPTDPTKEQIVDELIRRMQVKLSPAERELILTYMDRDRVSAAGPLQGKHIIDPFAEAIAFDSTTNVIDIRARGAVYLLAQHPSFQIR